MTIENLYILLLKSYSENTFIKAILGNQRLENNDLKNVIIKPVKIKDEIKYSFVFRNKTNDITKNYSASESIEQIKTLLQNNFLNADIFTNSFNYHVFQKKTGEVKVVKKEITPTTEVISLEHNHQKTRIIGQSKNQYLQELGLLNKNGEVKKEMQHKFKQINRYVEIVADVFKEANLKNDLKIVDMGCGKGYLTFALADYELGQNRNSKIVGIEIRNDLVDLCNTIARNSELSNLNFKQGSIKDMSIDGMNVLIALHACDTATDDAIIKGINAKAEVIICAPCCHKQIRKEMKTSNSFHAITKHGILLERQAEIVTDSLRSLWLESKGYKTKVFDFVDVNNTPKNVMIVAIKTKRTESELANYLKQYNELKNLFGIDWCAIENQIN